MWNGVDHSRAGVINLGSVNALGVHEFVFFTMNLFLWVRKPKANKQNTLVVIRPFGSLFSLIAPQLQSGMFMLQVN